MTFALFVLLWIALFFGFINILPVILHTFGFTDTIPSAISTGFTLIIGYAKAWNFFFPITELLVAVGIITGVELGLWAYRVLKYVIGQVRGTNSGA